MKTKANTMNSEQKIKKIARIYDRQYKRNGLQVTTHLYYNLMGAIIDLKEHRKVDSVILGTLNNVAKRIAQIGKLLPLKD